MGLHSAASQCSLHCPNKPASLSAHSRQPWLQVQPDNVELVRRDYVANGGWETFLAYEDPEQDILVGYHA